MHLIINVHTLVFPLQKPTMTAIVHFAIDGMLEVGKYGN